MIFLHSTITITTFLLIRRLGSVFRTLVFSCCDGSEDFTVCDGFSRRYQSLVLLEFPPSPGFPNSDAAHFLLKISALRIK